MINLKTSQLNNKSVPDSNDYFRFISGAFGFKISWSQIKSALGIAANNTLTIIPSSSGTIQLINSITSSKATIDYVIKRGLRYRIEQIQVLTDGTNVFLLSSGFKTIPLSDDETTGITITGSIVDGYAVLTITADNSDINSSIMTYKITFNG